MIWQQTQHRFCLHRLQEHLGAFELAGRDFTAFGRLKKLSALVIDKVIYIYLGHVPPPKIRFGRSSLAIINLVKYRSSTPLPKCKSDKHPKSPASKIDPIVVQPRPAAELGRLRAAAVPGVAFGLLLAGWTVKDGLHGCAQQRIEQRPEQTGNCYP